jgi:cytochrome c oxidase subunit 3
MTISTDNLHGQTFRAGEAMGLDHRKLGMWLFIATEVMLFGALITAFLHTKLRAPAPELSFESILLVGINTFILVASSFFVAQGLNALRAGRGRAFRLYLALTIFLGAAFLSGQAYEFWTLHGMGLTMTGSLFGSAFFTLTGTHGLHVLIGLVWAAGIFLASLRRGKTLTSPVRFEIFGLYWHFVDVVWIALFTLIYLI